jgi:glycosyltransferase involved in cell wall biosynthesis
MKNSKLTILTPYYPTKSNKYGGIFVYDQTKVIAEKVRHIDVYVIRPWFKISRKFPFISSSRDDLALKDPKIKNVSLKLIRYFPFPKDSIFYHLSLSVSIFLNKRKFSENLLVHTIYPLGAAVQLLKLLPTIVIHGSDFRYFSSNAKQSKVIVAAVNNSCTVCVSEGLMQEVKATNGVKVKGANINVIENGVLIQDIKGFPQKNLTNKGIFKFVFVGSLIKLKGVYELLDAFSKLQQAGEHQEYSLTFVGEGIEKNYLEKKVKLKNIKNVSFLGALENETVMLILAQKDCLILPSYQEGFGRVIIEMLSLGKPVISTKSGGPEFILNEQTGLIVPPKNVKALKSAMKQVCCTYETYNPTVIKKYVYQNYSLAKQTSKLLNCVFRNLE